MANGFNTDYSFLNLPEAGSSAQGPIEAPSFDPTDFSFDSVNRFAPDNLPTVDTFAPSGPSLTSDQNDSVLNNARPFEDVRTLGATFGQKLAETERFFGERVSGLQGNIDDLINTKSDLTKQLEAAFLQQDEMSQQAIEEQIAALDAQRADELTGTIDTLQGEINEITGARDSAVAERDQALADNDTIRAEAANSQAQALDAQAGDYQSQLDELTGQSGQYETQLSERDQTIADLQAQLEGMQVPPGETPPPPPGETPPGGATGAPEGMMSYQDFLAQGGSAEDYQNYLNKFLFSSDNLNFQMDGLQNPSQEVIDTVQNSLATGVPAITNDGVQDMINKMGNNIVKLPPQKNPRDNFMSIAQDPNGMLEDKFIEAPVIPRRPFVAELPPIKTKRDDFMSIAQKPKMNPRTDGIGRFLGKKLARMGRR